MRVVIILLELLVYLRVRLKQVIDRIGGKVVVLGCPAEEGGENGSAKASYVKVGIIDDIDIALMIHPGNATYPTIDTLAVDVLDIKFYGKSAHASENRRSFKRIRCNDFIF